MLDLGAGTGKLTRALVARGCATIAVDPSPEMLARLQQALPEVETHAGTAESIPLPDGCVDAVVVGQAWHWVDPHRAAPEIARILRPGGVLGLVWNVRDDSVDWMARLSRLLDRGTPDPSYNGVPLVGPPFGSLAQRDIRWDYRIDEAGLLDLAASRSVTIMLPPAHRALLETELRTLFADVATDATMTIPYVTHGFRAALPR